MIAIKNAKRAFKSMLFASFVATMTLPMTANAADVKTSGGETLSVDVRFKAAKNLLPGTEYDKHNLKDIVDVSVLINGTKDALASTDYYAVESEVFDSLGDKNEESVKEVSGFTTKEDYEGDHYMLPVTFVAYHDFTDSIIPEEYKEAEKGQEGKKKVVAEDEQPKQATYMATKEVVFCVTHSADDVVKMYKSGEWYETSENGVTWKYTISKDGFIDKLYTENNELSGYIISGAFMVPSEVNDIPVVGIGSGSKIPFIPESANGYERIDFPETLKVIGDYSFYKNRTENYINLPISVMEIGEKAFFSSYITELSVFGTCDIGEMAFANCRLLEKVALNGDITVGRRAFDGGVSGVMLSTLTMSGSPVFKEYSFCNNINLKELTITDGAILDQTAFTGCSIEKVKVMGSPVIPEGTFGDVVNIR